MLARREGTSRAVALAAARRGGVASSGAINALTIPSVDHIEERGVSASFLMHLLETELGDA
eukprot:SAG11_NODE_14075_length_626_cov_1.041746_1_plen_60_part_10